MNVARQLIIALLVVTALAWNFHSDWDIVRMSDRQNVAFSQMMSEAQSSPVLLVGESHDNKLHHELQLDVIRDLHEKKKPLAIGLEMFQTDSQKELDDWVAGKTTEEEFQKVFARNWSVEWSLYRDIFVYAKEKKVPLVALNIPLRVVTKVAHQGFSSLTAEDKKDLPPTVSCRLNTAYTDFLKRTYGEISMHAMNRNRFVYFCEAQTLRNNGMAWNVSRYRQSHPHRQVVILTGILHAVKTGIPEHLAEYGEGGFKVILPELPEFEPEEALVKEADYLVQ